jgi:hypothetical protein
MGKKGWSRWKGKNGVQCMGREGWNNLDGKEGMEYSI